ncbi:dephospho-CoA kinase [Bifidobacterium platyrrhinorum]|uniref:Dephospho-CoA kinase n=1 Tax=Bifidobacterium platyrrhinorum TaxID=2661628 RepID=A0A6L9SUE3_9BIFI|nr:dephospho-CoA kinase [Bifidobacterium platyrrhinorum]NEG55685.1 dephospho-CoA kinase [Bifidobacterium platyrrhinorum]
MIRIGLTGGIAAGKSTVAARMRGDGALHIDYDAIAHEITGRGGAALAPIAREFGDAAIAADGTLDRVWVADHVFGRGAEPGARERLDAIEHPLIYAEARRREDRAVEAVRNAAREPGGRGIVVVHDVPLLAEVIGDIPFRFDHIVTVEAPEDVRVARMIATRGMTREQAEARIRHQSTRAEREAIADAVIDSTQPLERMFDEVDRLYAEWSAVRKEQ